MLDYSVTGASDPRTHLLSLIMNQASSLSIAQITDTHLFADEKQDLLGLHTVQSFQVVVKRLHELRTNLDLLLVTGDLSQDGTSQSYSRLQSLLNPLNLPVYWLPGNHDCPDTMAKVLNQGWVRADKSFQRGGWNFILLNSRVPGRVHGHLSTQTLVWLELQLKRMDDKPTVIALHHPPFPVDSRWLDSSILRHPEALFAVCDRFPQVKLVLCGHIHQEFHRQRHGVDYLGTPSTSIQFEPHSHKFALDEEKPGFRLLQLYPDGSWTTQIERVDYTPNLNLAATGY